MPGADFEFHGLDEAIAGWERVQARTPEALVAILTESGLFGERETKLETRVDTGRARASIGHFTPNDLTTKATAEDAKAASDAAYFDEPTPDHLEVSWGSRVVYVPVLNYKLGDLMFEKGLQAVISYFPRLCDQYLSQTFE